MMGGRWRRGASGAGRNNLCPQAVSQRFFRVVLTVVGTSPEEVVPNGHASHSNVLAGGHELIPALLTRHLEHKIAVHELPALAADRVEDGTGIVVPLACAAPNHRHDDGLLIDNIDRELKHVI